MKSSCLRRLATALLFIPALLSAQSGHPITVFSTYLGGSGVENLRDVTSDDQGNVYVTGGTSSADYPTTPGAYDRSFATGGSSLGTGGPMDVFVAKYSPTGQLLWSTLLGGPNYDRAYAIEVDREGYVYVGGRAGDEFPTTAGVLQESFAGDRSPNRLYGEQDAFVAKLSPDGDSLIWATYFGADDLGFARDIDIDAAGNVYLAFAGSTRPNPHITAGAFQTTPGGAEDMIVAKISGDGTRVIWATYYGGSGYDGGGPAVRVHTDGTVYVVGGTDSRDLPHVGAGAEIAYAGGRRDFQVARFSADGSRMIWGTLFGGSGNDDSETHGLALDADGNAYITGFTNSDDLPITTGPGRSGPSDIPLAKFRAADGSLLASRYLGGSGGEGGQGIAIGRDGRVVVGGGTGSTDFPVSADAVQSASTGGSDMVVAILESDFTEVIWSSILGGSADDEGRTLWADRAGNVYLAGHTDSRDFPLTDPAQAVHGGGTDDGLVTRLCPPFTRDLRSLLDLVPECWSAPEGEISPFLLVRTSTPPDSAIVLRLTVSGNASYGEDHLIADTLLIIDSGRFGAWLGPLILDDDLPEGIEYIEITATVLSGPGYFNGKNVARIWIHDDETPSRNLLIDPGFEEDSGAWQKTSNGGRSIDTLHARSGRQGLRMVASNQYAREVYQDLPVTPGMLYLVSGHYRDSNIDYAGSVAEILWLDESGEEIGRDGFYSVQGASIPISWAYSSTCLTAPERAVTARFRLSIGVEEDGEGELWFDDLGFYRADGTVGVEEGGRTFRTGLDLR